MSNTAHVSHVPVLICRGLGRSYQQGPQRLVVLRGLDLTVCRGERIAITGASGSGKTTLLNLLGGIDSPDEGEISIDGQAIAALSPRELDELRNKKLGFVYQFHHLLGEFNAQENVAMPLLIGRQPFKPSMDKAMDLLQKVGLAQRARHRPSELSGGERQRVAIARALVNDPACVLMDEPTGNLDRHTAESVQQLMLALNRDSGTSFIVVTHDPSMAARMDRTLNLVDGQLTEVRA